MSAHDRVAEVSRSTGETSISLSINLDGSGKIDLETGIGFLDHMLSHIARHGLIDIEIEAEGDLHVDQHHTVEDIGICLGQAIRLALADKAGISRYGDTTLPMDETLVTVALDFSGRPYLGWNVQFPSEKIGVFDTELVQEFWRAVTIHSMMNLHVILHHGSNSHHIAEAIFKAAARAIRQAAARDPRVSDVPSTKGSL